MKLELSGIDAKMRRIASDQGLGQAMTQEARRVMSPYVPFRSGALDASAGGSPPFKVVYGPLPYARYIYYGTGLAFSRAFHGKATALWAEVAKNQVAQACAKVGTAYLKGR